MFKFNIFSKLMRPVVAGTLLATPLAGCAKEFNSRMDSPKFERKATTEVTKIFVNGIGNVIDARSVNKLREGVWYLGSSLDYSKLPKSIEPSDTVKIIVKRSSQVFGVYNEKGERVLLGPVGTGRPGQYDTELGEYEAINLLGENHRSSAYSENGKPITATNLGALMSNAVRIKALQGQNKDGGSVDGKALHGSSNVLAFELPDGTKDYAIRVGNSHGCLNLAKDMAKFIHEFLKKIGGGIRKNKIIVEE